MKMELSVLWIYAVNLGRFYEFIQILNPIGLFAFNLTTITLFCAPSILFIKNLKFKKLILIFISITFFGNYLYGNYILNDNKIKIQKELKQNKSIYIKVISPNFELKYNLSEEESLNRIKKLIRYSNIDKDRKTLFAFIDQVPKNKLVIKNVNAVGKNRIECFGSNKSLRWKNKNEDLVISVPGSFRKSLRYSPVYVLKIPVRPYLDAPDVLINVKENFAEISIGPDDLKTIHMYKVIDLKTNTDAFKKYENA